MSFRRPLRELERSDWIFLAAGAVALVVVAWITTPETLSWSRIYIPLGLWVGLAAFVGVFSQASFAGHAGLENVFILGIYLAFDVQLAAWAALFCAVLAELSQPLWAAWLGLPRRTVLQSVVHAASHSALQVFSLLAGAWC